MKRTDVRVMGYRTVEGVVERHCTGCDLWRVYDAEHFGRHGPRRAGLHSRCKSCERAADAARHRERYRAYRRAA